MEKLIYNPYNYDIFKSFPTMKILLDPTMKEDVVEIKNKPDGF